MKRQTKKKEVPDEWTELVQTRIGVKAREMLGRKASEKMESISSYLRKLIYRDVDLITGDT